MIEKFLPKFHVVEPNNLVGLRNGHMIAQSYADANITKVQKGSYYFVENGCILGLDADNVLNAYSSAVSGQSAAPASHNVKFLHFTEELNTFIDELDYFAVPLEKNVSTDTDYTATFPRAIALYVGDTFTTDNYDNTAGITGNGYAKVVSGVLTLQSGTTDAEFRAVKTTLPNGSAAYEFTVIA